MIHAPKLGIDLQRDIREILILPPFIERLFQLHAHRRYTELDIANTLTKAKLLNVVRYEMHMNHLETGVNEVVAVFQ